MRFTAAALALFTIPVSSPVGAAEAADPDGRIRAPMTQQLLARRAQFQAQTAARSGVFHGFQFTNQVIRSGITFVHQPVDDAGRDYKAVQYDHGNGVAAADVDGDGRLDLYFTTQLGSNGLWRNLGDGRFEDITRAAGVGMTNQISVGAAFGDVDNDGDPDLFVTTVRKGNRFFLNQGGGRFEDRTAASNLGYSGHSSGAAFFDYDRDGRLDLLVANIGRYTTDVLGRGGYHVGLTNAFDGHLFPERSEANLLYRNEGGGVFREVAQELGLRDLGWTGEAAVVDFNEDGYPDLYVANMQGDDRYWENESGKRWVERTAAVFPKTPWGSVGVTVLDANADGRMDVFVTDMHSDMTRAQIEAALSFRPDLEKARSEPYCTAQWTDEYLQGATNNVFGNALYLSDGKGGFAERAVEFGAETYWPWGPSAGDLNADGFEDVLVTAGMGYPFRYAINSVLLNDGGKRWVDAEFLVGVEPRGDGFLGRDWFTLDCDGTDRGHPGCQGKTGRVRIPGSLSTRSSLLADLDGDGDLDVVTHEFGDRPQILFSNLAEKRAVHRLEIQLVGVRSNRDAVGARVSVRAGGRTVVRFQGGKSGYLAHSAMPLYFGLGAATEVEEVEVAWPSGERQRVRGPIPLDRRLTVREGDAIQP